MNNCNTFEIKTVFMYSIDYVKMHIFQFKVLVEPNNFGYFKISFPCGNSYLEVRLKEEYNHFPIYRTQKMQCGCNAPYYGPSFTDACPGSSFFLFMSFVDVIIRNMCEVSEACHRVIPKIQPDSSYDFVVIGGGSGGATAAGRLAEDGKWKVLLIEAGIDEPTVMQVPSMVMAFGTSHLTDWGYKTEPEPIACQGKPGKRCTWSRAKILGGCSVHNAMKYLRGVPKNYDDWAAAGNEGWSYKDVLPIFKRSERYSNIGGSILHDYHGTEGPMTVGKFQYNPELNEDFLSAAKELDIPLSNDLNGRDFTGFEISQVTVRNNVRLSAARAFLRPQRNNTRLHVMLNSTVTKILINEQDKRALGVEFTYNRKTYKVRATKEVILSAGTINSPQLLLLSGVGPKDVLDQVGIKQIHELPGVGKNLTNHVAFTMTFALNKEKNYNLMNWQTVNQYAVDGSGPLSGTGLTVRGRINSKLADPDGKNPDLLFTVSGLKAKCSRTGRVDEPSDPENPDAPRTITIMPACLQPLSRGYVSLRSNNPLDAPIMVGNYFAVEEDMNTVLEGIRIAQKFTNSSLLVNKYGFELKKESFGDCSTRYKYDSDDFWKCAIGHTTFAENHQTSTCRMGPSSDSFAVVDNKLRVRGIKNLRIADASVMPNVVSGNTHATVVMIAERAVDFIKEEYL